MGKSNCAHRIALSLTDGDWDSRLYVLHRCDNTSCCNPAHLWRGTQSENLNDMLEKGRQHSKLSIEDVQAIRASSAPGRALAREYGVSHTQIGRIRSVYTWKHIT
jgi:hypothetical protein